MFFQKKIERIVAFQREKAKEASKQYAHMEPDEDFKLDFKDIIAIILSAFIVFGPILLVLIGIMYLILRM